MEENYWLEKMEFEQKKAAVGASQPVEMAVMDRQDKMWKKAKVQVFDRPVEGSHAVALMGPFGEVGENGKYYVKIIEMVAPSEDEL